MWKCQKIGSREVYNRLEFTLWSYNSIDPENILCKNKLVKSNEQEHTKLKVNQALLIKQ